MGKKPCLEIKVQMSVSGKIQEHDFNILKDSRSSFSLENLKSPFDFLCKVIEKFSETNDAIKK
jgi:hypothetical protein